MHEVEELESAIEGVLYCMRHDQHAHRLFLPSGIDPALEVEQAHRCAGPPVLAQAGQAQRVAFKESLAEISAKRLTQFRVEQTVGLLDHEALGVQYEHFFDAGPDVGRILNPLEHDRGFGAPPGRADDLTADVRAPRRHERMLSKNIRSSPI